MLCGCSRVFKTPQELEVMRFANRVSSEAHKEVKSFYQGTCQFPFQKSLVQLKTCIVEFFCTKWWKAN